MNTTAENTVITERSGALQLIELNRPEKSNAVTFAMYDDLTAAISRAEQDSATRVILIHGRGDSFTTGNARSITSETGDCIRSRLSSNFPISLPSRRLPTDLPSSSTGNCESPYVFII